jgi:hypothetical protein
VRARYLHAGRQQLEDVIDLVLEAAREHFVGLVQHKHLDVVGAEHATLDHVVHTAHASAASAG